MLALAPESRSVKPRDLSFDLKLPLIIAPMFLISGPALVVAAAEAGVIAAFPAANARTVANLDQWMASIQDQLAAAQRPRQWGVGLIVHRSYDRFADDLALVREYRPRLVTTALGDPRRVIDPVHAYGGQVFCDVVSVAQARKAAAAGVDGLVLVCAGAGGHTGTLNPFAFVDEVRRFWPGQIALSGAIANGRGVWAAQALGADLAYIGTRFIAARESLASDDYRQMLVEASAEDIVTSDALTGVSANWLRQSLERARADGRVGEARGEIDFADIRGDGKAWKDIWGSGQGVGAISGVQPLAQIVAEMASDYAQLAGQGRAGAAEPAHHLDMSPYSQRRA